MTYKNHSKQELTKLLSDATSLNLVISNTFILNVIKGKILEMIEEITKELSDREKI